MSRENSLSPELSSLIETSIKHHRDEIERDARVGFGIVNKLVLLFSRELSINPIQQMQIVFDREGIPVQFVAIPKWDELNRYGVLETGTGVVMKSDTHRYGVAMPHDSDGDYDYYLHTIVKRPEEYCEKLALLGISTEENLRRLGKTGILFPLPGSDEARIIQSPNN